jgi:hypothetical protein
MTALLKPSARLNFASAGPVQDLEHGSIYGLEKLWAFFAYSKVNVEQEGVERSSKVNQFYPFFRGRMTMKRAPMMFISMLILRPSVKRAYLTKICSEAPPLQPLPCSLFGTIAMCVVLHTPHDL